MIRKRELFIEHTKPDGEVVIKGQYWDLKEPGHKPPRCILCTKKELEFKKTSKKVVKRSHKEKHNYLMSLYNERHEEIKLETKAKRTVKDEERQVSKLMADWLDYAETKGSPETKKIYLTTVNYYLKSVGDHQIDDYDYKKYLKFLKFLKAHPNRMGGTLSDTKIRGHFRQLRAFYNWCFKHRILDRAFYIELPQETKKEQRPYETKELIKLKKTIQKSIKEAKRKNHRICRINDLRALIILSYTGMRRGAIWSLRLDHIDLDRRIIKIRRNEELNWNNKKLKERDKPILSSLYKYLKKDLAERGENEIYYLGSVNK